MEGKLIIVEGLPGVGKTVFGKSCASFLKNVVFLEEWVDEFVLREYLSDMKKHAATFQMHIQRETVERIKKAIKLVHQGTTVILDRGLYGNRCFAEVQFESGMIGKKEMEAYRSDFTYESIEGLADIKSVTIYMKATPEFALERIRSRQRDGESAYKLPYLQQLCEKHDEFLNRADIVRIIKDNSKLNSEGLIPLEAVNAIFVTN